MLYTFANVEIIRLQWTTKALSFIKTMKRSI